MDVHLKTDEVEELKSLTVGRTGCVTDYAREMFLEGMSYHNAPGRRVPAPGGKVTAVPEKRKSRGVWKRPGTFLVSLPPVQTGIFALEGQAGGPLSPDAYRVQVPREMVQRFACSVGPDRHDVFDPDPELARQVDARLHAEDVPRFQRLVVALDHVG
ncbi:MAG: hypothetical protein PWP47_943 [Synergistaceae bacterium]|nr:hypothetical protein [Synergistaceae bacterium]